MEDLAIGYAFVIFVPLLVVVVMTLIARGAYALIAGGSLGMRNVAKAALLSLGFSMLFPVVFSLTVGLILGPILGFGYVIFLLVLTSAVTLISFFVFLSRELPSYLEVKAWLRAMVDRYIKFVDKSAR